MKTIINIKYKFWVVFLCVAMLELVSCSEYLEEDPYTSLTEEEVYGNEENLKLLISGLYTQWRNTRQDRSALYMVLGSDEGKQGGQQVQENNTQAALDKYNGAMNPFNSTLAGEWNKRWPVISAAAKAVHYSPSDELKAEASFIRASINFELAMLWGPIPIIDLEDMKESRQPLSDVFQFIINDLEFASEHLPLTQDDKRIPTKGAAQALLGKVYMYAPEETGLRDYQKAVDYFDMMIPNYALIPNYKDLFDTRLDQNTSEVIYAFQFNNMSPDNNMIQHHAGSRAVADMDSNTYFGGYDLALPTQYYYETIWEGQDGDTRREVSIRYDFTLPDGREPQITWTGQSDELEPHIKKFEDIRTQGEQNFWYSGGLVYYLRLADILLCKAECLNELGRTGEAINLVNNTVRARAYGGTLPASQAWPSGTSQAEFGSAILDERMRELGFEGWRRMDLIRTGHFVEYVKERNPWAKESGTIQDFHKWYPIPESEIKQNDNINEEDQNPGY
ncbi:RagB/SusD family nutrient uptake outer membrane protein [Galbibacter pacificus]|uniref:RagB/SusD family nutrient uptake outer membrane protein n=1 Tax=Galbibacter pacificus TaxID=2996052 RepID=A0ABT6FMS7_9FLAO|nr:RagB/SusD family nutrient uptake outer membrane protein [Galbibacter pacificus]MDG3581085.1 RagB/SusD family nutrient uptake outer membrane protein [Galbibacter pacificus]MDG3584563.1 RagB/SusD family nutrient uptake outer membrane protein [Galbibacter pacificus]